MTDAKKKRGRPSVVEPHKDQAVRMLGEGYTIRAIAEEIGAHASTLERAIVRWEKEGTRIVRARRPKRGPRTPAQKALVQERRLKAQRQRGAKQRLVERGDLATREGCEAELVDAISDIQILIDTEDRNVDRMRLMDKRLEWIEKLRSWAPAPQPDPEDDPTNKGCTDVLLARGERERKAAIETLENAPRETLWAHITGDTA